MNHGYVAGLTLSSPQNQDEQPTPSSVSCSEVYRGPLVAPVPGAGSHPRGCSIRL